MTNTCLEINIVEQANSGACLERWHDRQRVLRSVLM